MSSPDREQVRRVILPQYQLMVAPPSARRHVTIRRQLMTETATTAGTTGVTAVVRSDGVQPTKSDSSRRMAAFGRAPTIVLTSWPLENTAMVGIDITW